MVFLRRGFHFWNVKGNVTSPKRVIMQGLFSKAFGTQDALQAAGMWCLAPEILHSNLVSSPEAGVIRNLPRRR